MTDFGAIEQYADFVAQDRFRNGLHYPAVIPVDTTHQRILDIGCGDGRLPRILAARGARVAGYDIAHEKIAEARAQEARQPLGIDYDVATPQTFRHPLVFNHATSVMVLPYAPSPEDLAAFFQSAYRNLLVDSRFTSVLFSPSFKAFGEDLGSRRFNKLEGDQVEVEFIDPASKQTQFTSVLHQYSVDQYEQAAREGGMTPAVWSKLFATRQAIEALGEAFWEPVHREQPYAVFEVRKER